MKSSNDEDFQMLDVLNNKILLSQRKICYQQKQKTEENQVKMAVKIQSKWKGHSQKNQFKKILKQWKYRKSIIQELIDTEH